MSHLTNDLLEDLKRITAIPVSQATFTDQILVDFLNDELLSTITPILMDVREEFFIDHVDYDVNTYGTTLSIPSNTIGEKLRDVVMVANAGGDESYTNLPRLSLEQLSATFSQGNGSRFFSNSGFIVEGNKIKLYPVEGWSNETIRLYFYRRPGELILVNEAANITAVDTGLSTVTVNVVPSGWAINKVVDIIESIQPFGTHASELTITNIVGQTITLDSVDNIVVGDYVAPTGQAPLAQIPKEAQRLLVQSTKVQILESLDDDSNWTLAKEKYDTMLTNFLKAVTNRVDGQPKKIISRNNIFNASRGHRI